MNMIVGLLLPFAGTVGGAAMVYFMKEKMSNKAEKLLLGFASGIMVAASIFSLLLPALESSNESIVQVSLGFLGGMGFLLLLDSIIPHLHLHSDEQEGMKASLSKSFMMLFAVFLHNIPEGIAVGIVLANMGTTGNFNAAMALSLGIALQNFPEGTIISMPLYEQGNSKTKSFLMGVLSGAVEPIAAIITILLTDIFSALLPLLLSFAAGAMFYVVIEELIPESQSGHHTNIATIGFAMGFVLMMILDVTLG